MAGITDLRPQAQMLQAAGRGQDTYLVHMGPQELQSMEALANQHQMSLTVNPKTGLYEVGILSSILPIAADALRATFGMP